MTIGQAALFSAVVTTFLVLICPSLDTDHTEVNINVLVEVALLLRAGNNATARAAVAVAEKTTGPSSNEVWAIGIWLTSLVLAISAGLLAVLAKQWLRHYGSVKTGTARERAFIRHYRWEGFDKWKVAQIIGFLPVVLHLSVLLFLAGLVVWLYPLHATIARIALALGGTITTLYIVTTSLPAFVPQCPYRTQIPFLLQQLRRVLALVAFFILWPVDRILLKHRDDGYPGYYYDVPQDANQSSRLAGLWASFQRNVSNLVAMAGRMLKYSYLKFGRARRGWKQLSLRDIYYKSAGARRSLEALWRPDVNLKETERRFALPGPDVQYQIPFRSGQLLEWLWISTVNASAKRIMFLSRPQWSDSFVKAYHLRSTRNEIYRSLERHVMGMLNDRTLYSDHDEVDEFCRWAYAAIASSASNKFRNLPGSWEFARFLTARSADVGLLASRSLINSGFYLCLDVKPMSPKASYKLVYDDQIRFAELLEHYDPTDPVRFPANVWCSLTLLHPQPNHKAFWVKCVIEALTYQHHYLEILRYPDTHQRPISLAHYYAPVFNALGWLDLSKWDNIAVDLLDTIRFGYRPEFYRERKDNDIELEKFNYDIEPEQLDNLNRRIFASEKFTVGRGIDSNHVG